MKPVPFNPAQLQAIEHQNGPLLVLAGAGSGKTRVITHRVARLIERGIPPTAIIALTFTNKAAGEMRERIESILPTKAVARALTVSTFHSFGLGVLTKERSAAGGTFTIYDQGDAMGVIKHVLRDIKTGKNYDAASILARISNAKNALTAVNTPATGGEADADFDEDDGDEYASITRLVMPKYESALRQLHAFDFDDLVCQVVKVWHARKDVLTRWQERYRYILVDEYQDTNRVQLELLKLLGGGHTNVCVVGDDDQSIYAWRGADVRNILEFETHFPGAKVVKLEQNYRSRAPILAVANAVIEKRRDAKYRKTLFTEKLGGDTVYSVVAPTPEAEARHVGSEIRRLIKNEGRKPSDIAVLYRSNGQSKGIEEALREQGVPHRVVGGQQFFERKEVKDALAYLKVALNPNDEISLRRIINYPARGIGDTSVERLSLHAAARGWSLWQAVERVAVFDDIASAAREGCKQLEKELTWARQELVTNRSTPSALARQLFDRIGLRDDVAGGSGSANVAARKWGNVEGFLQTLARRETREKAKGADGIEGLGTFLHALTLDFSADEQEAEPNTVTLSTLHGCKGLEFEVVFLIGCEEGYLPHTRTLESRVTDVETGVDDIEEERRLFYVGVTRARERLILLRSKGRAMRGKFVPRTPSRFLLEIPKELLEESEAREDVRMDRDDLVASADALLAALDALK